MPDRRTGISVHVEHEVVRQVHREHKGVLLPVFGHVGYAGVEALAGRGVRQVLTGYEDAAAQGAAQARYRLHQLCLAVPLYAGQGHDLAGAYLEVDAVDSDQVAFVGHGEDRSVGARRRRERPGPSSP